MHAFTPFTAQVWNGHDRLVHLEDLSIDAAREIARSAPLTGHTGRIMAQGEDYCEVYSAEYGNRVGTFADTTLVIGASV